MLEDILNEVKSAVVNEKTYKFEFDHAALAVLEKNTQKSMYEIYDTLLSKSSLMIGDLKEFVNAGLLKHHETSEIFELQQMLLKHPGVWYEIKEAVFCAFLYSMMPPESMKKIEGNFKSKKKDKITKKN